MIRRAVIGVLIAWWVAPGCDRAPRGALPTDSGPRLAVLSPALCQTLRDLGAADRVVARHGWDSYSPGELPVAGSETGLDYEVLLRVRPTHVVMQTGAQQFPPRLEQLARDHGWEIVGIPVLRLDDVRASIARLGRCAGAAPSAVASAESTFDRALSNRPGFAGRAGSVLTLAGVDPPAVMGPGSFHYELVERLGAVALPREGAAFIQLSLEDVAKLDPDSLVLVLPGASSEGDAPAWRSTLGPLARLSLRCVREGRVALLNDPLGQLPATSLARVADSLADTVATWTPLTPGSVQP